MLHVVNVQLVFLEVTLLVQLFHIAFTPKIYIYVHTHTLNALCTSDPLSE